MIVIVLSLSMAVGLSLGLMVVMAGSTDRRSKSSIDEGLLHGSHDGSQFKEAVPGKLKPPSGKKTAFSTNDASSLGSYHVEECKSIHSYPLDQSSSPSGSRTS